MSATVSAGGPFAVSGSISLGGPFTMLGGEDAAACEGDACVVPAAVSASDGAQEVSAE